MIIKMHVIPNKHVVYGISLIEAVVTLGVVMLLITGLVIGMTSSLQNAQTSKARGLAVQYAQEALEIIREERDNNWTTFSLRDTMGGTGTGYCMNGSGQLSPVAGESCPPFTGSFSRFVRFITNLLDSGQMDVEVAVSWMEGNTSKNITLKTKYTQWK